MIRVHADRFTGLYHPVPTDHIAWTVNDTRGYVDEGPDCDECGEQNLSFAYVCLDGGDSLCETCAEKEGIEHIDCDC